MTGERQVGQSHTLRRAVRGVVVLIGLSALLVARCGVDGTARQGPGAAAAPAGSAHPPTSEERRRALGLDRLRADTTSIRYFPKAGPVAAFTMKPEVCARPRGFFEHYAADFELRPGVDTLTPTTSRRGVAGTEFLDQRFRGVAVDGYGYVLQLRADGCVDRGTGHLLTPLYGSVTPRVDRPSARRIAYEHVGEPIDATDEGALSFRGGMGGEIAGRVRLSWAFRPGRLHVVVDATDGSIAFCVSGVLDGPPDPRCARVAAPPAHPDGTLVFGGRWYMSVSLDGEGLGISPREVAVAPGPHTVTLEQDGKRETRQLDVVAGTRTIVQFD